jgi:glycosyltransferase involved in cell wall biosynthesis
MHNKNSKTKVCYVLSYRCPDYVRTKSLIQALKKINDIEIFEAVNRAKGMFRYAQTLCRLFALRIIQNPDYYILGFRGYEIFWGVRIITLGRPLIVDHMMSPYDSLVNEKKIVKKGGVIDRFIRFYEKSLLRYADIILTDTDLHRIYFADQFAVLAEKIHPIPVGADENVFRPVPVMLHKDEKDLFAVLFYGSFLPLHGINIILTAAHLLRDKPIRFTIIGGKGRALRDFNEMRKRLKLTNIIHKVWIPYEQLPDMIQKSDVCLGGPFGDTGQAHRVITGKTFQSLAMGKAVIVGKTGHDDGFRDKENCLLVSQGKEEELAGAILWCFENQDQLPAIGSNGLNLYRDNFSTECMRKILQEIISS